MANRRRVDARYGRLHTAVRALGLRRVATGGACLAFALGLTGCVDHDSNAARFCSFVADEPVFVTDESLDRLTASEDVAKYVSDELEKEMRYAEDATREVRLAARDMADAYLERASLAGDDDATEEELEDNADELEEARGDVREACGSFLDQEEGA